MDAVKKNVSKFLSSSGKHDTSVHEEVAPAVTQENVTRTQHDETHKAVDREVHQDHYHTSVQPIQHQETLAEQHHHVTGEAEKRHFEHDNDAGVKSRLAEERAKFSDTQRQTEGKHTKSDAPVVTGEHKHHHVYETIQPVVQKETVEPHVVHTTVPVHEVHHQASQHHSGTALPSMTMAEFQKSGGSLTGREARHDHFAGEPRQTDDFAGGKGRMDQARQPQAQDTATGGSANQMDRPRQPQDGHGYGNSNLMDKSRQSQETTGNSKPGMMDKVNPSKDADGDGKAGFMS